MYYIYISDLDFKSDSANIGPYIQKRFKKNGDLTVIVNSTRDGINPSTYAALQNCQPTSASVERSFSMLGKLLAKDRNFLPGNVEKYLMLHYNSCTK